MVGAVKLLELVPQETSFPAEDVDIELHAQDIDRSGGGWAAVIPQISTDRLRMKLYPSIRPEVIYTRTKIRGDVVVISRATEDGTMEVYLFHLVRLRD